MIALVGDGARQMNGDQLEIMRECPKMSENVRLIKDVILLASWSDRCTSPEMEAYVVQIETQTGIIMRACPKMSQNVPPEKDVNFWTLTRLLRAGSAARVRRQSLIVSI